MSEDHRRDISPPDRATHVAGADLDAPANDSVDPDDGSALTAAAPRGARRRFRRGSLQARALRGRGGASQPEVANGDGWDFPPSPTAAAVQPSAPHAPPVTGSPPPAAGSPPPAAGSPPPATGPPPTAAPRDSPPVAPPSGTREYDGEHGDRPPPPAIRRRVKKLRLAAILLSVAVLGLVSFVFGMFMAVASDVPGLGNFEKFNSARNSILVDDQGRQIAVLSDHNRILVTQDKIPTIVKQAVIATEDKRFYSNSGIDFRGIARAFFQDVMHNKAVQGASTIEQQFVKNALQAQAHRTIFEKLREAALAYHLTRRWSKEKILTAYLNTIYFGSGAYGIESAAHTYFGADVNHQGCGTLKRLCISEIREPWEAALLAGMIASPSAYDPAAHPIAAKARRNLVLKDMWQQGYLTRDQYQTSIEQALPAKPLIQPPRETSVTPTAAYFTTWVRQQLIDRYGAQRALEGGLRVRTTLDLDLQRAAEQAIGNYLADPSGPSASLVAIDNATGSVRAMVGGRKYSSSPFNLATEGERQPGSAFKAFVLAQALHEGVSPDSIWSSRVKTFTVPNTRGREHFVVHNDNNAYSGTISLNDATAYSDNSVFAEMGIKVGTRKIARLAERMGIRTPVSTNPAVTIGGLKTGVTALDMAHAFETLAHGGQRVGSSLVSGGGPTGIEDVQSPAPLGGGRHEERGVPVLTRVLPTSVVNTETQMLQGVIQYGTAKAAAIGQFAAGKTGTTSNYGDAWFVGWNDHYTVAVWVGYPDQLKPMKTEFNGGPVLGGTFPALIWHDFMTSAIQLDQNRAAARQSKSSSATTTGTTSSPAGPSSTGGSGSGSGSGSTTSGGSGGSHHGSSKQTGGPSSGSGPAAGRTPSTSSGSGSGSGSAPAPPGGGGSGSGSGAAPGAGGGGGGSPGAGSGSGSSGTSGSGSATSGGASGGTGAPPG